MPRAVGWTDTPERFLGEWVLGVAMAGDWIKMRVDLPRDSALQRIANYLHSQQEFIQWSTPGYSGCQGPVLSRRCGAFVALAALHSFWSWAQENTTDGRIVGARVEDVELAVEVPCLADALIEAGWLVVHEWGLLIPKYNVHNGKGAKERARKQASMAVSRESEKPAKKRGASVAEKRHGKGLEKRREESNTSVLPKGNTSPSKNGASSEREEFETWWSTYPKKVGKEAAFEKWQRAIKRYRDQHGCDRKAALSAILDAARKFSQSPKASGKFCPQPATWLKQGRWDDDPATWQEDGLDLFKPQKLGDGVDIQAMGSLSETNQ